MRDHPRYGIEELTHLSGISRRAVRFYIQEGLVSPPEGLGRGPHYSPQHLAQIIRIRDFQEQGKTLQEILVILKKDDSDGSAAVSAPVPREQWVHLILADGLQLQMDSRYRLPSPRKLAELAKWCSNYFRKDEEE